MPVKQRNYKTKDVKMLNHKFYHYRNRYHQQSIFTNKRATWADPFFDDLKEE